MFLYLVFINIFTFVLFGTDKFRAEKGQWRISEKMLLSSAFLGGAAGACLGMKIFHHKTRKPRFKIGIPILLMLQIVLLALCYENFL